MEKLTNYYTAASDQDILSVRKFKEIINQIPEDKLDFELVVVAKVNDDLRGIPVSNVILDDDGKQLTIFDFVLRNRLRIEALNALNAQNQTAAETPKSDTVNEEQ